MIARLRQRLNDLEERRPLAYAVVLIVACDLVIVASLYAAGPFA